MNFHRTYEEFCAERAVIVPNSVTDLLKGDFGTRLDGLSYRSDADANDISSLAWALALLHDSAQPPPPTLLPLLPVDDASIACLICAAADDAPASAGQVVRWHLGDIPRAFQGAVLDSDAENYLRSVADELEARKHGLATIKSIATKYQREYVSADKRPRGWAVRPVQLACQNVIIGLSAFQHDATFDGLRVPVFLSCEAPHLATHEANRALTALMLCDAFQNGGTMEVRFGPRNLEQSVPPGLRRFGRSLDLALGAEDDCAITPTEARELFLAVTPMPDELWARAVSLLDRGLTSPERICYVLLASVWRAIELDYILATSSNAASILEGGTAPEYRRARLAELEVSRAALMIGMFFLRLSSHEKVDRAGEARVYEDGRLELKWIVNAEEAVVAFTAVPNGTIPWSAPGRKAVTIAANALLLVVPRALPIPVDCQRVRDLQASIPNATVALLAPMDMAEYIPQDIPLLLCPDRLCELDNQIESKLQSSRISRS